MKVKGQILICTAIMLNDHSNPNIESTTVLSDIIIPFVIYENFHLLVSFHFYAAFSSDSY